MRRYIIVRPFVSRRRHKENALLAGGINHFFQGIRIRTSAPRVAENLGAVQDGIFDTCQGIGSITPSVGIKKFKRHNASRPTDTRNTDTVVPDGGYRSGAVRTVLVVIHRIAAVLYGIVAVNIVNYAVPVIVDSIPRNLSEVNPHICSQVLMVVIHAGVNNTDNNRLIARCSVPRQRS